MMSPEEATQEIRECLRDNLGVDNLCVRVLVAEVERLQNAIARESMEIDQVLGKALGYPPNPDGGEGVCTGDHVSISLATEAADEIERLRALVLTPVQLRALANFILRHGELSNAQGLTALILRNMAEAAL